MSFLRFQWKSLVVLTILAAVFLAPGLKSNYYISPSGILQFFPLFDSARSEWIQDPNIIDPLTITYPAYKIAAKSVFKGDMPLWNPYNSLGMPLAGNVLASLLFPLSWFYILFGFKIGAWFFFLTKLVIGGFGAYLFLKQLKLKSSLALIGGACWMFSGFTMSWLLWAQSNTVIFLPYILLFIEKIYTKKRVATIVPLALMIALTILGGHPGTILHILTIATLYALVKLLTNPTGKRLRETGLYATGLVLGILLAAIQLLPFLEYQQLSMSAAHRAIALQQSGFPWRYFVLSIFPDFFGSARSFFGPLSTNHHEISIAYYGTAIFLLALIGFLTVNRRSFRLLLPITVVGLLATAVVFGVKPLPSLMEQLPGFNQANNARLYFMFGLMLITWAMFGLNHLLKGKMSNFGFITALCLFFLLSFLLVRANLAFIAEPIDIYQILFSIASSLVFVFFVFWISERFLKAGSWIWYSLLLFGLTAQTAGIFYYNIPYTAKDNFFPVPSLFKMIQEREKNNPDIIRIAAFSKENKTIFPPGISGWYGLADIRIYDALQIRLSQEFLSFISTYHEDPFNNISNFIQIDPRWANFLGLKYYFFLANEDLKDEHPRLEIIGETRGVKLYQNSQVAKSPFIVHRVIVVDNDESIIRTIKDGEFDPQKQIVVAKDSRLAQISQLSVPDPQEGREKIECRIKNLSHYFCSGRLDSNGVVVFNNAFYPGWKAKVNGQKTAVNLVDYAFPGIYIQSGEFNLIFEYAPRSFSYGALISLITLMTLLGFGVWSKLVYKE